MSVRAVLIHIRVSDYVFSNFCCNYNTTDQWYFKKWILRVNVSVKFHNNNFAGCAHRLKKNIIPKNNFRDTVHYLGHWKSVKKSHLYKDNKSLKHTLRMAFYWIKTINRAVILYINKRYNHCKTRYHSLIINFKG